MQQITVKVNNWTKSEEQTLSFMGTAKLSGEYTTNPILTIRNPGGEVVSQFVFGFVPHASTIVLNWWAVEIADQPAEDTQAEPEPVEVTAALPEDETEAAVAA